MGSNLTLGNGITLVLDGFELPQNAHIHNGNSPGFRTGPGYSSGSRSEEWILRLICQLWPFLEKVFLPSDLYPGHTEA